MEGTFTVDTATGVARIVAARSGGRIGPVVRTAGCIGACMVGLFTYNPPLCMEALKQAGKLGQVKVVAFDEAPETLEGIKDGTVHGTVVQNPFEYGRQSVQVLRELVKVMPVVSRLPDILRVRLLWKG